MADWVAWHDIYANPSSPMSRRLSLVQRLIARRLDRTWPKPLRVLSICAGDGRDILQVLAERDDANRVTATLLEMEPVLCARARATAAEARLENIHVRQADAGISDAYAGAVPADLILLVGALGHITDDDARTLFDALPAMCNRNAMLIWSRRRERDLIATLQQWLAERGFAEVFASPQGFHVGVHRFTGQPTAALPPGRRIFSFVT